MEQLKIQIPILPIIASISYFAIAAILGLSMRLAFVIDLPEWFNYRHIQHAHSHVALLGWLYAIFFIIILRVFRLDWYKYSHLYWITQATTLGMLLTFPVMGYAAMSIAFSTLHIILTYVFIIKVWLDVSTQRHIPLAVLFLRASLFFLALSTLGTWALGPIIAAGMKGSALYYASIQFYLHFQFNGWLIFAALASFFGLFQLTIKNKEGKLFFWTLVIGTVMTYALAIAWSTPHISIFFINSLGALIQLLALGLFIKLIILSEVKLKALCSPYVYHVIIASLLGFALKVLVQSLVAIPALAEMSYTIRNLVIGFIHLLMLGGLSLFAFSMISHTIKNPLNKKGTIIFIIGVITSEFLLFGQGLMQWQEFGFLSYYYEMIALASTLIVLGTLLILYDLWASKIRTTSLKDK